MRTHGPAYLDRKTGRLRHDAIYAHGFLDWAYNSSAGWALTHLIFSRRIISQLYGWANKQRWSCRKIRGFVESMGVDMDESLQSVDEFTSFNDFICREIDLSRRPIASDSDVCVAPVDARVLAYPTIGADDSFAVKRNRFVTATLLGDAELAERYLEGSLLIFRLYLTDYHHFHFPDAGVPHGARAVRGRYFAVSPYSRSRYVPFFSENHRVVTEFDSDHFGRVAMVEVGALTVGSIQQRFTPDVRVRKGDHKGLFELGGSVVVLLFEPGAIELDEDLCGNTRSGLETLVRLGESIGRVPRG
jgi:phosphatidylserine decarboxylase